MCRLDGAALEQQLLLWANTGAQLRQLVSDRDDALEASRAAVARLEADVERLVEERAGLQRQCEERCADAERRADEVAARFEELQQLVAADGEYVSE